MSLASRLPPARDSEGPYRVALVCLGNICRSPIAHVVLQKALDRAGVSGRVEVDSSGTGDWHLGHPMDRRAAAALASAGYDGSAHRAQQFTEDWYDRHDLILAMDESNFRDISALAPDEETAKQRVRMFREFDPRADYGDMEVPDPYYGEDDGFTHVLRIVERTSEGLAGALAEHLR
ncbi:MAG: low molecular weight phosphotyrosine protein phosphatase [Actinomycetota bacterium]|nr:low molecular weight phosphotyrosine protein phosphatase [Actinomycetota bacterium]